MPANRTFRRTAGLAVAGLVLTSAAPIAIAVPATWVGTSATNYNWNNGASWSTGLVPTASTPSDGVLFSIAGSSTATVIGGTAAAAALSQTQGDLSLNINANTLAIAGNFAVNGTTSANPLMTLSGGKATAGGGLFVGTAGNTGRLTVTGSAAAIDVVNDASLFVGYNGAASNGTLNLTSGGSASARNIYIGYFGGTGTVNVGTGGTLSNAPTSTVGSLSGNASINIGYIANGTTAGTLLVSDGGTLKTNVYAATTARIGTDGGQGTLTVQGSGTWTHKGNVLVGGGAASGTLNVLNGATVNITSTFNNGTLQISTNGSLNLSGGTSTLNVDSMDLGNNAANVHFTSGTLNLAGAVNNVGSTPLSIGGTLGGGGTVNGSLTVPSGGKIRPGDGTSADLFSVTGSLNVAGTMQMRLLGVNSNSKIIVSSGTPTLSGVIALSLANTYTPAINASFDLLDFTGTLSPGYTFDFSDAPLPAGRQWNTSQFAATGAVSVEATPEPGSALLAMLALSPLLTRRKRRDGEIQ